MTPRVCMWSGPRNISTAMMRSFENRADTFVVDEPFYAAYLTETGHGHPMRDAVLASQPVDRAEVARDMTSREEPGRTVFYQKHMTHHMPESTDLGWARDMRHAFLIREPAAVLASYARKHDGASLEAIGVARQAALFDEIAALTGTPAVVVDARDVLTDPARMLPALCEALAIPFDPAMLAWPVGSRDSDGAWAPAWYDAVLRSTGFGAPPAPVDPGSLPDALRAIAEEAAPFHARLAARALRP